MNVVVEENKRHSWESFLRGDLEIRSRPFRASLEITRNCNFKCNMCPQSWMPAYRQYHPEFNMTPALFRRITEEIFPCLEYAHLQGFGESVISPYWLDLLDLCEPYVGRLGFGIVTNLGRRNDAMWRRMIRMGFDIVFSCDGATRHTFETIRRFSSFEMILHNLEVLKQARSDLRTGGFRFHVTLQRLNYREMPFFVDLAGRFDVREVDFISVQQNPRRTVMDYWKTADKLRRLPPSHVWAHVRRGLGKALGLDGEDVTLSGVPQEELSRLKEETLLRGRREGIRVTFSDSFLAGLNPRVPAEATAPRVGQEDYERGILDSSRVSVHQRCFKPYSYILINYKGDVGLCNHLLTDDSWEQMGNLFESSFEEIWNSTRYQEMRRRLAGGEPPNKTCRWCFLHRLRD